MIYRVRINRHFPNQLDIKNVTLRKNLWSRNIQYEQRDVQDRIVPGDYSGVLIPGW